MIRGKKISIWCPSCEQWKEQREAYKLRADKAGLKFYCSRKCAGIGRRKENPKSTRNPEWKKIKREYDAEYRVKNLALIRAKKSAYYAKTGPLRRDKEREIRKKRMPAHIEYCRQPEYKKWKSKYDEKRRDQMAYGSLAEVAPIFRALENEINSRIGRSEIYRQNGTQCKSTKRRREYDRITNQVSR